MILLYLLYNIFFVERIFLKIWWKCKTNKRHKSSWKKTPLRHEFISESKQPGMIPLKWTQCLPSFRRVASLAPFTVLFERRRRNISILKGKQAVVMSCFCCFCNYLIRNGAILVHGTSMGFAGRPHQIFGAKLDQDLGRKVCAGL